MTTFRAIAIDDEPFGLRILADDLQKIPSIELIGTFTNPLKAMELIQQDRVDLMFLDIQMPTLLGTQFLRTLPKPPLVIFTTAYEQYALEGYELDVVDYLMKPIRFERLFKACNKAIDLFQQRHRPETDVQADTYFFVHSEYKEVKIYHHDILYIEGLKDYVKIFLASQAGKPVLTRLNVKAIEARLDSDRFCRVHQSFIIPLNRVSSFQKTKLLLNNPPYGPLEIPVGGRYADEFLAKYRGE
ncbi:LytR/AlgR family response regulator transcription factor [Spirosoma montaniterrae]|uniref:Two-component system response regulator n=1 Tax=Spirosoma montaniterrae TaxID=1178516 RepID=A0A1P9X293_9BACT|nr:response regulator transcription factor [Spirosoma montaniterrae]AQG81739.1 two-component system response regulator [Spirosoma montaniterrae]